MASNSCIELEGGVMGLFVLIDTTNTCLQAAVKVQQQQQLVVL